MLHNTNVLNLKRRKEQYQKEMGNKNKLVSSLQDIPIRNGICLYFGWLKPSAMPWHTPWKCNINMAMWEYRLREVNTNCWNGLPLGFINGHCKTQPDWELFPLELEMKWNVLRGRERDPRYEHSICSMFSTNNLGVDCIILEWSNNQWTHCLT